MPKERPVPPGSGYLTFNPMQYNFDSHLIFDIGASVVSAGWIVVGLKISNILGTIALAQEKAKTELLTYQAQVKLDLITQQTNIKEDLLSRTALLDKKVDTHTAEDLIRFDNITHTLTKIDTKLDGLTVIGLHK